MRISTFILFTLTFGCATWLMGQSASISGVVLDENQAPFAGATVLLEGTNYGAVSDGDGKYSIDQLKAG
jgi:hypothetical protein